MFDDKMAGHRNRGRLILVRSRVCRYFTVLTTGDISSRYGDGATISGTARLLILRNVAAAGDDRKTTNSSRWKWWAVTGSFGVRHLAKTRLGGR